MRRILLAVVLVASKGLAVAIEDTQCTFWTDKDIYERNANLKEKNDSYDKALSSLVKQECLVAGTNKHQSCQIDLKEVNDQEQLAAYAFECTEESAGILWICDYWPQCGDLSMEIQSVMVCASPKCQDVSSLIPHADLLGPLNEQATVCASMFTCTPTGDINPKDFVGDREDATIDTALPEEEDSTTTKVPVVDIGNISGGENAIQQATDGGSSSTAFRGEATYGQFFMTILLGFILQAIL